MYLIWDLNQRTEFSFHLKIRKLSIYCSNLSPKLTENKKKEKQSPPLVTTTKIDNSHKYKP